MRKARMELKFPPAPAPACPMALEAMDREGLSVPTPESWEHEHEFHGVSQEDMANVVAKAEDRQGVVH